MSGITLRELQAYIRNKDHQPDLKLQYLQKLVEEVGELTGAMRKDVRYSETHNIKGTLDEELYNVLYYVAALANTYDVDLEETMKLKEPIGSEKYGQQEKLGKLGNLVDNGR